MSNQSELYERLKQQIEKDCAMSITVARTEIGGLCSACQNSKPPQRV